MVGEVIADRRGVGFALRRQRTFLIAPARFGALRSRMAKQYQAAHIKPRHGASRIVARSWL
jgi:hypothetical protein